MNSIGNQASKKKIIKLKVVMLGDPHTGKTSFVKRYAYEYFTRSYVTTCGVDFATKTMNYDNETEVKFHIWDIPGEDAFICLTGPVFRGAHGALILFDISEPKTRESALLWKVELDKRTTREDGSTIPSLLLANKSDLAQGMSKEEEDAIKTFALVNGFIGCIFISVKYDIAIEDAVRVLTDAMIKRQKDELSSGQKKKDNDIIKLSKGGQTNRSGGQTNRSGGQTNPSGGCPC